VRTARSTNLASVPDSLKRDTTNSTGNLREREIKYAKGKVRGEIYGEAKR